MIIVHGRDLQYNNCGEFGVVRLCRSPSPSSRASSRKLTPESDSSQDSIPASLPAATAKLRIKSNSPSMEQHLSSSSSGLSKRPAADEPLDKKPRKRSERCNGSSASTNNKQRKTCEDDSTRIACHPRDSWRNMRAHDHRRVTASPQALRQDDVDINLTKRHDTVMGHVSPPQKPPQKSESFIKK